jgi:hypothetical protein
VAEYERCLKLKITVPAVSIIVNVRTAKTGGSNGDLNFVDAQGGYSPRFLRVY